MNKAVYYYGYYGMFQHHIIKCTLKAHASYYKTHSIEHSIYSVLNTLKYKENHITIISINYFVAYILQYILSYLTVVKVSDGKSLHA